MCLIITVCIAKNQFMSLWLTKRLKYIITVAMNDSFAGLDVKYDREI